MARAIAQQLAYAKGSEPEIGRRTRLPPGKVVGDANGSRAKLVAAARHYLRCRRQREEAFPSGLFADPAWDMLLDLFACASEGKAVTVTDACIAASVPATTALRWVSKLEECGLLRRRTDPGDGRRIHLELTAHADELIAQWLQSAFAERAGQG